MFECVFRYLLFSGLKEEGILRVPGNAGRVKVENPLLLFWGYREGPNELHCFYSETSIKQTPSGPSQVL